MMRGRGETKFMVFKIIGHYKIIILLGVCCPY